MPPSAWLVLWDAGCTSCCCWSAVPACFLGFVSDCYVLHARQSNHLERAGKRLTAGRHFINTNKYHRCLTVAPMVASTLLSSYLSPSLRPPRVAHALTQWSKPPKSAHCSARPLAFVNQRTANARQTITISNTAGRLNSINTEQPLMNTCSLYILRQSCGYWQLRCDIPTC